MPNPWRPGGSVVPCARTAALSTVASSTGHARALRIIGPYLTTGPAEAGRHSDRQCGAPSVEVVCLDRRGAVDSMQPLGLYRTHAILVLQDSFNEQEGLANDRHAF